MPGHALRRNLVARLRSSLALILGALFALPVVSLPAMAEERPLLVAGDSMPPALLMAMFEGFARDNPGHRVELAPILCGRGSIKALVEGTIDLVIADQPPDDSAPAAGLHAVEWLHTPLVVGADPAAAPDGLSGGEIIAIYAGWSDRWPNGGAIRLVLQPHDHPLTQALRRLSTGMAFAVDHAVSRPGMTVAYGTSEATSLLAELPGAVGGTTLGQVLAWRGRIKYLRLDGREPSLDSLTEGNDGLKQSIFLVTAPGSAEGTDQLVAYLREPTRHAALTAAGYVPVAPVHRN